MKYSIEVEVDVPRAKFLEIMRDPEATPHWQEGFLGMTPLSGEPGAVGSKNSLRFKMGKGEMEMIETITAKAFPDRFVCTYEAPGVWNLVDNNFSDAGAERTIWRSDVEFRFTTLMMKVMGAVAPFMFKKQTRKYMTAFKAYVEGLPE